MRSLLVREILCLVGGSVKQALARRLE